MNGSVQLAVLNGAETETEQPSILGRPNDTDKYHTKKMGAERTFTCFVLSLVMRYLTWIIYPEQHQQTRANVDFSESG